MIPKIIHYTWFSGDEYPEMIKKCIESWKKVLPDYELRLWDMDAIKNIDSIFLKEALSVKKWAYAADFVRLYVLYHEGGIYLDTDVMVFKSFDNLLDNQVFIGKEDYMHFAGDGSNGAQYLSSHCIGAVKKSEYIRECLSYYDNRHFILSSNMELPPCLRYNYVLLPYIQAIIAQKYGYRWNPKIQEVQTLNNGVVVYPSDWFCGFSNFDESYCAHLTLGSWRENYQSTIINNSLKYRLIKKFKRLIRRIFLKTPYMLMRLSIFEKPNQTIKL